MSQTIHNTMIAIPLSMVNDPENVSAAEADSLAITIQRIPADQVVSEIQGMQVTLQQATAFRDGMTGQHVSEALAVSNSMLVDSTHVISYSHYESEVEHDLEKHKSQLGLPQLNDFTKATVSSEWVLDDCMSYKLHSDDGEPLAEIRIRALADGRLWTYWRENLSDIKGTQAELQRRVADMYPGRTFVSSTGEMSPEARKFRNRFMADHPNVRWELDPELEGDEGVPEATPHVTRQQASSMLIH